MPGTAPYVELHAHSAYSFLDGASLPEELLVRAAQLGYGAFALTDHDNVAGAMELAMAARDLPLRAIFGAEVTVCEQEVPGDRRARDGAGRGGAGRGGSGRGGAGRAAGSGEGDARHLTLLVEDGHGWRNVCRLLTLAHAHTRDSGDRRAGQPSVRLEQVCEHAEGLVCLTGCAQHGVHEEAPCRRLLDAFGPGRLRVELQRPYARGDAARNRMLERLARRLGVPTVATGDVHAHTHGRALLQDALVAAGHGLTLDASEVRRRPNHCHVLARPEAMAARFRAHRDAVAETVRLSERLGFDLSGDLGYRYPGSDGAGASRELAGVCRAELAVRYPPGVTPARRRGGWRGSSR
jgi:error-prone DNA polymerase